VSSARVARRCVVRARRPSRVDLPGARLVHEPAFRAPYRQTRDLGREAAERAREVAAIPDAHDDEHPLRLEVEGGRSRRRVRHRVCLRVRRRGLVCVRPDPQRGGERGDDARRGRCGGDESRQRERWPGRAIAFKL